MTARKGLCLPPGPDEVMPPGERRRGEEEGRRQAWRREGRGEERRTQEEGVRGRGEGKRAAWEGRGEAWGWGLRKSSKGKGRGGGEEDPPGREGPRCAGSPALPFPLSLPASPSLSSPPGRSPRRCVTTPPAGAGGEATAKLSAHFAAWPDVDCEARLGGGGVAGVQLTLAATFGPRAPPLSSLFSADLSSHPASTTFARRRIPPLVWWGRGGAQSSTTRTKIGGRGGRAPVPWAERKLWDFLF